MHGAYLSDDIFPQSRNNYSVTAEKTNRDLCSIPVITGGPNQLVKD